MGHSAHATSEGRPKVKGLVQGSTPTFLVWQLQIDPILSVYMLLVHILSLKMTPGAPQRTLMFYIEAVPSVELVNTVTPLKSHTLTSFQLNMQWSSSLQKCVPTELQLYSMETCNCFDILSIIICILLSSSLCRVVEDRARHHRSLKMAQHEESHDRPLCGVCAPCQKILCAICSLRIPTLTDGGLGARLQQFCVEFYILFEMTSSVSHSFQVETLLRARVRITSYRY
eukprot:scaffold17297_cov40-Attheya_sp.AAC.1